MHDIEKIDLYLFHCIYQQTHSRMTTKTSMTTTTTYEIIDKIKKRKTHANRKKLERSIRINEILVKVIYKKDKVIKEQENKITKCNIERGNEFEFRIPRISTYLILQFWSAFIIMFSKNSPEYVHIIVSLVVLCLLTNSE